MIASATGRPSPVSSGFGGDRLRSWNSRCDKRQMGAEERSGLGVETEPAVGYTTSPVLKTGWGTGPMPLHAAPI